MSDKKRERVVDTDEEVFVESKRQKELKFYSKIIERAVEEGDDTTIKEVLEVGKVSLEDMDEDFFENLGKNCKTESIVQIVNQLDLDHEYYSLYGNGTTDLKTVLNSIAKREEDDIWTGMKELAKNTKIPSYLFLEALILNDIYYDDLIENLCSIRDDFDELVPFYVGAYFAKFGYSQVIGGLYVRDTLGGLKEMTNLLFSTGGIM